MVAVCTIRFNVKKFHLMPTECIYAFPNWQKESWQTSEETSRYVRPERVNKWPNSMTDRQMMMMMMIDLRTNRDYCPVKH